MYNNTNRKKKCKKLSPVYFFHAVLIYPVCEFVTLTNNYRILTYKYYVNLQAVKKKYNNIHLLNIFPVLTTPTDIHTSIACLKNIKLK